MEEVNLDTVPVEERRIKNEPEWHKGSLARTMTGKITHNIRRGVQQTDSLKPFYRQIFYSGLQKTYEEYKDTIHPFSDNITPMMSAQLHHHVEKTKKPRKVIIVGAGMAGLSAAYELRRAGHSVQILEMTQRAGGRVKTFGERDGFAKGLYVDGEENVCSTFFGIIYMYLVVSTSCWRGKGESCFCSVCLDAAIFYVHVKCILVVLS